MTKKIEYINVPKKIVVIGDGEFGTGKKKENTPHITNEKNKRGMKCIFGVRNIANKCSAINNSIMISKLIKWIE